MQLPPVIFETQAYRVHWQGHVTLSKIRTRFNEDAQLRLSEAEKSDIERAWQLLRLRDKRVEDLPLYRLLSARERTGYLVLSLGLTGYKEYQGTNIHQPS